MRLRPYKACDAKYIVKWIQDEKTFFQWSADRINVFPLTEEVLNEHYRKLEEEDSFWEFTATNEENVPIGHLIMRYIGLDTVNLGFVIVDDSIRGKGYGKQLIQMAKEYAFTMLHANKVRLGVFVNNPKARYCYESAGFRVIEEEEVYQVPIRDEVWECVSMQAFK